MQGCARHTCFVQQRYGKMRDQRCLLGGFRQNCVARSKRCADLTCKNGEREVPRRDTCKGADGCLIRRAFCIVTQEINGFTQLSDTIKQGFTGFTCKQREQFTVVLIIKNSGLVQDRATFGWTFGPSRRPVQRSFDLLRRSKRRRSNSLIWIVWIGNSDGLARLRRVCDKRRCLPFMRFKGCARCLDPFEIWRMAQIESFGVHTLWFKKFGPRRKPIVRAQSRFKRVDCNLFGADILINNLVHERTVCTVFKQTPNEIGQ